MLKDCENNFGLEDTDIENGQIIKDYSNEKNVNCFYCRGEKLISLKNSPKNIKDNFDCCLTSLKTLEGGPEYVGECFNCSFNNLKSLKGCPKEVKGMFDCQHNDYLKDISDLPSSVKTLDLSFCKNVKVFTKKITTKDGCLRIIVSEEYDKSLKQRIIEWYDVVYNGCFDMIVKTKPTGKMIIDNI